MFWFGPDEKPTEEDKKILHALNLKVEAYKAFLADPNPQTLKAAP
jgi:hypothetical protein